MKRTAACLDSSAPPSHKLSRSSGLSSPANFALVPPSRAQNGFVHFDTPRPKVNPALTNGQNGPAAKSTTPAEIGRSESMSEESRSPEFFLKLSGLNKTFARWIENYMAKGVHYDFTPVCHDYIRFIDNLRTRYPELETDELETNNNIPINKSLEPLSKCKSTEDSKSTIGSPGKTPMPKNFFFNQKSQLATESAQNSLTNNVTKSTSGYTSTPFPKMDNASSTVDGGSIQEIKKPATNNSSSSNIVKSLFSFGKSNSDTNNSASVKPFGLGNIGSTTGSAFPSFGSSMFNTSALTGGNTIGTPSVADKPTSTDAAEDEEYEPPKVESVNFEEDALYSIKCKLFYKSEDKFVERGKGMLYLKKMPADGDDQSKKHQLLIRADNANGTILLNILLSTTLPTSQSKSGILLTCIPNPAIESANDDQDDSNEEIINNKAVTFFIKVKSIDAAKETHEKLKEMQKAD